MGNHGNFDMFEIIHSRQWDHSFIHSSGVNHVKILEIEGGGFFGAEGGGCF